jgi:hypothetical protein
MHVGDMENLKDYQLSDVDDVLIGTLHQAVLKAGHHLEKLLEYLMLSSFPGPSVQGMSQISFAKRHSSYSCVKDSSGCSESSPIRRMPLLIRALRVHMAWTVRPKCLP